MFPIKIGTLIPAYHAPSMLPALNKMGFECYEMNLNEPVIEGDLAELAKQLTDLAEGRPISALGLYGNTLTDEALLRRIERAMDSAHLFGCDTICLFAGGLPGQPVPDCIPEFKRVFGELVRRAEDLNLSLAIENCTMGSSWNRAAMNIGYCPDAWKLMFDAVPSDRLGLEWEPCHALCQLMDPIPQLREWAPKVKHVHGKDATVLWDVIRSHGLKSPEAIAWNRTPGFGDTDWNQVMTILKLNGYTGTVDIEGYHDPAWYRDLEWSAQLRALNYLKDCRGGREFIPPMAYNGYQ